MAEFTSNLLIAQPIAGGFSWTLASRLGALLAEAETRYGARDPSFTILGFEFRDGVPQVWFPGNRKHVVIQLGAACLSDEPRAVFQLAHECVHLLHPILAGTASVLEEGLATHYSIERVRAICNVTYSAGNPAHERAAALVDVLLASDPAGIRSLRARHSSLSAVTPDELAVIYPSLKVSSAEELCQRFGQELDVGRLGATPAATEP